MRRAMSLARWLLAVGAETPARAASSPAGRASPPASARHMAAREGSAMRFATNAMLGSLMPASLARRAGGCFTTGRSQMRAGGGSARVHDERREAAIVDVNHAEAGRPRVEVHAPGPLRELDARGRRGQQRKRTALDDLLAVDVAADDPLHLMMPAEHRHQVAAVAQRHRVHPRVAE